MSRRALALLCLLLVAPAAHAAGALVLTETVVPGVFVVAATAPVPGTAAAMKQDLYSLDVPAGSTLTTRVTWTGDARLALSVRATGDSEADVVTCVGTRGSVVSGANEVIVTRTFDEAQLAVAWVGAGLVAEETPYVVELSLDGEAPTLSQFGDDLSFVAFPWAAACRL